MKIFHRFKQKFQPLSYGLSLRRDQTFIPNIIICVGVVFVRRGLRNLIDLYFFPEHEILSNSLAILIGVFLLYLPDNSFKSLGGYRKSHHIHHHIVEHQLSHHIDGPVRPAVTEDKKLSASTA